MILIKQQMKKRTVISFLILIAFMVVQLTVTVLIIVRNSNFK